MPAARQGLGRAARRRRLARWKKTQRRALVATAVALVGGGLTVAGMDRPSGGDRAQAATAPQTPNAGTVDGQPGQTLHPSTQPGTGGPSSAGPQQPGTPAVPHRQSATTPYGATPDARPDGATTPRTTVRAAAPAPAPAAPQPQAASRTSGGASSAAASGSGSSGGPSSAGTSSGTTSAGTSPSHTATSSGQSSAPAASNGSATGTPQGSGPAATQPSPAQLCLLVVCLG
ncbi:hypothetical protein [Streptomyces sp. NPDC046197]|uniref:hypothetical protein n=1 Tax=Streptomyces sp. NPDC046197 TaxID=3154337 RepID=UPI0033ED8D91